MKVSIIIACRNEEEFIRRCLDSLIANDYPDKEIIVVDGMSTDRTWSIVQEYCDLTTAIRNPEQIKAPGLNKGIRESHGGAVMIADAHAEYPPDYVSGCMSHIDIADNVGCDVEYIERTKGLIAEAIAKAAVSPLIKAVKNPKKIASAGWNKGIEESDGDLVMIAGAHSVYQPDYVINHVNAHRCGEVENVGGSIETEEREDGVTAKAINIARDDIFGAGPSAFRQGTETPLYVESVFGGCYRREVFQKVGYFNEKMQRSSDLEFNLLLKEKGLKTLIVPWISSKYFVRSKLWSFIKHNFKDGMWVVIPFKYARVSFGFRRLVPMAFVATLPFSIWPYLGLCVTRSIQIAKREKNWKLAFTLPIAFLALHLPYGLGSLWAGFQLISEYCSTQSKARYQYKGPCYEKM